MGKLVALKDVKIGYDRLKLIKQLSRIALIKLIN